MLTTTVLYILKNCLVKPLLLIYSVLYVQVATVQGVGYSGFGRRCFLFPLPWDGPSKEQFSVWNSKTPSPFLFSPDVSTSLMLDFVLINPSTSYVHTTVCIRLADLHSANEQKHFSPMVHRNPDPFDIHSPMQARRLPNRPANDTHASICSCWSRWHRWLHVAKCRDQTLLIRTLTLALPCIF